MGKAAQIGFILDRSRTAVLESGALSNEIGELDQGKIRLHTVLRS